MTFLEAYSLHGRNSDLIAKACGIEEPEAYNLIGKQADRDHRAGINRAWYVRNRAHLIPFAREAAE